MVDLKRIQSAGWRIGGTPELPGAQRNARLDPQRARQFAQALEEARAKPDKLRFSAHALERMAQRGIKLSPQEMERVQRAVKTAAGKGSRSSLVLLDENAFVVSIANRTVITALQGDALKDQVVTEIDSAVIL